MVSKEEGYFNALTDEATHAILHALLISLGKETKSTATDCPILYSAGWKPERKKGR